jgi:hypothetical protein
MGESEGSDSQPESSKAANAGERSKEYEPQESDEANMNQTVSVKCLK